MNSQPIASDLSYLVLQKRRERGEMAPCRLDSANQRLYAIPSLIANRRRFIADVELGNVEPDVMDAMVGYYRPARRKG